MGPGRMEGLQNAGMIAAAHRHPLAVNEQNRKVAAGLSTHLFYILQIDDRRAVNTREHVGIELLLEIGHGLAKQMGFSLGADADIILFSADPANIGYGKKENASARFKDDTRSVATSVLAQPLAPASSLFSRTNLCGSAVHGCPQAVRREGFEQVVHGVHFKSAKRICVPGGRKNDTRRSNPWL